jgi:competence protein ComEC
MASSSRAASDGAEKYIGHSGVPLVRHRGESSTRDRMIGRHRALPLIFLSVAGISRLLWAQANGKLQIHFIDVGQGDGAVLISPKGEVVLFDDGALRNCDKPIAYLQQLGITAIDYNIASHYHADHIGCAAEVLEAFPLRKLAYDRGSSYSGETFKAYTKAVTSAKRRTAAAGTEIKLEPGPSPVTIRFVALNGNGVPTTNENDLSLVSVVEFGSFRAEFGGDLSGEKTGSFEDIETGVAPKVGRVDVYKVHPHCSTYSSNEAWLHAIQPRIGIISVGDGNTYGHPTQDWLNRLHSAGIKTYWTARGNGGAPKPPNDLLVGSVFVEIGPGASTYRVTTAQGHTDTYPIWASSPATTPSPSPTDPMPSGGFAWSKLAKYYHYSTCSFVASILLANLERGSSPPPDKQLHRNCPR